MIEFPHNFLWGAATSAHQVEGNNKNNDWWQWEVKTGAQSSAGACGHYELYKNDFDLVKNLNHNCHRFSIEWSRIEPEEGKFSEREIAHYRDVIISLKERGIEPIVTLHHFTNPIWLSDKGGWKNKESVKLFLRYVERMVKEFAQDVRFWITINEPLIFVYHSYILGVWPPQENSLLSARKVTDNLALAHINSYKLIHAIYKNKGLLPPMVSIAKNIQYFQACIPSFRNKLAVYLRDRIFNLNLLNRLARHHSLDFIGVNYYSHSLVELKGWSPRNFAIDICNTNHASVRKNSLGWDVYPQGLYEMLIKLKRYGLGILITENGICTADDNLRWEFIEEHLKSIRLALDKGVNVLGYIYWSLLDNFEWDKGFAPRFGLIEVDYRSLQRSIRESAKKFALVCKNGRL